ncbi:ATP-binding protein [Desulfogranum japonicum]|uniref:ATP-binding protein n=1 Tax=Desulfogranum japonicum TaxID=231447 RepID=UPI00040C799F|nr:ATP-binding protein [Desulfogranum japonicum]
METLELTFPPSTRYVRVAAQFAANTGSIFCSDITEPETVKKFLSVLELVVSEACTNAVKHGSNPDSKKDVIIRISLNEEAMIVKVKDFNEPFDFSNIKEPDLESHPENGYGIFLMRSFMDEVSYNHEDGWNCITMVKKKPIQETRNEHTN